MLVLRSPARTLLAAVLLIAVVATVALGRQDTAKKTGADGKPAAPAKDDKSKEDKDEFGDSAAISLPRDNKLKSQIEAAVDYIKEEDWVLATEILQKLVAIKEDVFAKVARKGADGKTAEVWTSVRAEANRLIASLPPKGMAFYQLTYGPKATELLREAKATTKPEVLATVMRLYLNTEAGAEATDLLGTYHLDRGNYSTASRCFSLLLGRPGSEKLPPVTLFKAAYAFHMSGAAEDKASEEQVWKQLGGRVRELKVGEGEARNIDELQTLVAASVRPAGEVYASDSPLYRGDPSRSARGVGSRAFMEPQWTRSTLRGNRQSSDTARWLRSAEEQLNRNHQPVLPAFFPVTATVLHRDPATGHVDKMPLLVYRSNWGIHAVHMKTGELQWECPSKWSLDFMPTSGVGKAESLRDWIQLYAAQGQQSGVRPAMVFENSTYGSLSADANYVYAVEDLQVPPPATLNGDFPGRFPGQMGGRVNPPEVTDAIEHSRLQAFEISTGKVKWELGDPTRPNELSDCYFLGPPLPLAGKLYVLTERQQELRLVCIDPLPSPRVVAIQTLATTREKIRSDATRRTEAAHLAYAEGILVCPTNAGAVLGVDLLSNSLVWAYPYREKTETEEWHPNVPRGGLPPGWFIGPNGMLVGPSPPQQWKVTAPVIVDGKVVFTAPDSRSVHCVNLRDGVPLWKIQRAEDDQYLAGVFARRVLIVGKKSVRGLNLDTGDTMWTTETGMPSGQGVASDNVYYLPLKEAGQGREPEICAIEVETGQIVAHTKSRKKEVPGNLVFYQGNVVSQTATEVVAFPQLKVKLAEIDELITKNPNDPSGLTERGVLRLDEGDLQGAVDDLDKALRFKPDPRTEERARAKLFETLTEYFQKDFDKAEPYLSRFEELCKVTPAASADETERATAAAEERRRRANFLCLVAKGKEKKGQLVDAYECYEQFSQVAGAQELISVVDEPAVRAAPEVWTRGRIAAMVANATPEARRPLEERIAKRWEETRAGSNIEDLKRFVTTFGSLFSVGKEARLALAERLLDSAETGALVEAERQLSLLRTPGESPAVAARAVECLARLCTRNGLLEDAAWYYHVLGTQYASQTVRDGRSGADIFNELITDKRFLPLLDSPGQRALIGKVRMTAEHASFPYNQQLYAFEQRGEPLPFFREYRLALQYGGQMHQLRLQERATGEVRWAQGLTWTQFNNLLYAPGQTTMPRYGYQTLGHLSVLPIGHMVFGVDPVHKQVLWEKSLLGSHDTVRAGNMMPTYSSITVDQNDGGIDVIYNDGWRQRLGQAGPLSGNTVCLLTRDGLIALDPVSGRTMWTRSDVSPGSHIFGDDDTLYIVELAPSSAGTTEFKPSGTKAVRVVDGVSVKVPDFTRIYRKRLRTLGGTLLATDKDDKGAPTLHLYDVKTGKDLWTQTFEPNARILQSEEPHLAGAADPDGRVRVYDLRTRALVLDAKMTDRHHLDKAHTVRLLVDERYFYIACCESNEAPGIGIGQSVLMAGTGLRGLPVNGALYCFKPDGSLNWSSTVHNQVMVVDQFADLPVVLFASRYNRWRAGVGGARPGIQPLSTVMAIEKVTGKLKYIDENSMNGANFHALNVDTRAGRVELIGMNVKITFTLVNDSVPAARSTTDPGAVQGASARRAAENGR
jgi:outer membrane protein assembly factor BamB